MRTLAFAAVAALISTSILATQANAQARQAGTTGNTPTTTGNPPTTTGNPPTTTGNPPAPAPPATAPAPASPMQPSQGHSNREAAAPLDSCSAGPPNEPAWGVSTANAIKATAKATQHYLQQCHCPDYACVANALDAFADAVETFGPNLPREDADLPQIVRRAAARLRTAKNAREAHAALAEAAKAARAHVALFRVDDPDARSDGARAATYVADTLDVAAVSLSRVSGL
jgi:hypothetical protein